MCIKLGLISTGRKIKLIGFITIRPKLRKGLEGRIKQGRKISNLKRYMSSTKRY